MKVIDKRFPAYLAMSLLCGVLTFFVFACLWYLESGVSWFAEWGIMAIMVICWVAGSLVAWFVSRCRKRLPLTAYILSVCAYLVFTAYLIWIGDSSVNGFVVFWAIIFAVVSLPAYLLMAYAVTRLFR